MKLRVRSGALLGLMAAIFGACACQPLFAAVERLAHQPLVTNIVQFRSLSAEEFVNGCAFELSGVVTLVDTNRLLIVLQDSTDAVALHVAAESYPFAVGEMVRVAASNCCPLEASFPDYPHRSSGWDVRRNFEAPSGVGN